MSARLALTILTAATLLAQNPARRPQQPNTAAQPSEKEVPGGSVEGQVLNAVTGEPLRKVNLVLMPQQSRQGGPPSPYSGSTDANGQFVMKDIRPGQYGLMAERNGFVRTSYGSRNQMQQGSPLTVASEQTVKGIVIRMQPHAVISGRILDEDGEPVPHVQVQAMSRRYVQGRRQLMQSGGASTNDLGEYRIFGLAPGQYYISATHSNRRFSPVAASNANPAEPELDYAPTYYPGTTDASTAAPVTVTAGQPMTNLDMKLAKTRTVRVRGVVHGSVGRGRAMVMLAPRDSNAFNMFNRNMSSGQGRDGKFEINRVLPGSYWLIAQAADDGSRLSARVPVNVGNTNVEGLELTLTPGMDITGTVVTEGQTKPDAGQVVVNLQPTETLGMPGGGSARVKDDGTFVIKGVSADSYRVSTFGGGQTYYVKSVTAGQQEVKNGELNIVEGAPPVLKIVLSSAGGQVTGGVTNDKKEPAHGATVVLVPSADRRDQQQYFRQATVDQLGKFTLTSIAPGDYTLIAWDNIEAGAWQDPEFLSRYESKGKTLTIKENDNVSADIEVVRVDTSNAQ